MTLSTIVRAGAVVVCMVSGLTRSVLAGVDLIPVPSEIQVIDGKGVTITNLEDIQTDDASAGVRLYALSVLGLSATRHGVPATHFISLKVDPKLDTNDEGYTLTVHDNQIDIVGKTPAGTFYGVQTLRQLFPPSFMGKEKTFPVTIPNVSIKDQPRFGWRGMMLDVSRHFLDKNEVKNFLDIMAMHKMNTFHWHLTDDHGWRIEIKKYPKLTEIGAWRSDIAFGLDPKSTTHYNAKGQYGGFYTQDDIREVVAYAKERFITVVPEIEMPGHSIAALAAYPQYSCTGKPFGTDVPAGVHPGVYCVSNPAARQFCDDILTEVLDLFPSQFVHIGGDEVPKEPWKKCPQCQAYIKEHNLKDEHGLQSDFVKHLDKFLESKGRRLLGWDEILEGGLAPGATVMSWRGIGGGITAAKAGHDVVMTPNSHMYFDYYQDRANNQPKAIGGYVPLTTVYDFEPTIPGKLTDEEGKHILGVQANLWAEYFPNYSHVQYMALPRMCATAEIGWSPKVKKNWDDFAIRLKTHFGRLDAMGVNYYKNALDVPKSIGVWNPKMMSETPVERTWDITKSIGKGNTFNIEFQYTAGEHRMDIKWAALLIDGKEVARDTHDGTTGGSNKKNTYTLKIDELKTGTKYELKALVSSDGGTDSNGRIYIKQN